MKNEYRYFAFISYNSEDKEWAEWFQHELESYHLPSTLNGIPDIPVSFRPIFRDITELEAGDLPEQIAAALENSLNLIVICSPRAAQSEWVNKEIHSFIELGKKKGVDNIKKIFPLIIEGEPYSNDKKYRCFPEELLNLKKVGRERIGGDVKEDSREKAFVKVLAGMLPKAVTFDMLWNRYERDKIEKERKEREQRDKLYIAQSRVLADKSKECLEQGDSYMARMLALQALPKDLSNPNDRPYIAEAENSLRTSILKNDYILYGHQGPITSAVFGNHKAIIATGGEDNKILIWDQNTGKIIDTINPHRGLSIKSLAFTHDDRYLFISFGLGNCFAGEEQKSIFTVWDMNQRSFVRHMLMINNIDKFYFSGNNDIVVFIKKDYVFVYRFSFQNSNTKNSFMDCRRLWNKNIKIIKSTTFDEINNKLAIATENEIHTSVS